MSTAGMLARAQSRFDTAKKARDLEQARLDNRHWTELDSATGSGIRRKRNAKADTLRYNRDSRRTAVFMEFDAAEKHLAEVVAKLAAETAEAERKRYASSDLEHAQLVRDKYGWHKVVRVSAKSVTVATPYSWTDRISIEKVLEFR